MTRAQKAFEEELGGTPLPWSLQAVEMREQATAPIRPAVILLLIATTLVVLVAMGNVVGVGIARGEARAEELAVRMALGSGRGGAVAFVLAESIIIALLTAGVALGLDAALGTLVRRAAPEGMPGIDQVHLSPGAGGPRPPPLVRGSPLPGRGLDGAPARLAASATSCGAPARPVDVRRVARPSVSSPCSSPPPSSSSRAQRS